MRGDVRIERAPAQKINFNKLSTELDNAVLVEDFLWLPSYSHIILNALEKYNIVLYKMYRCYILCCLNNSEPRESREGRISE